MKGITAASFLLVLLVVGWSSAAPSAKQLPRHAASVKKVGRLNSIDTILPVMNAKARALLKSSRVPDKRGMLPGIAKQLPKVSTSGLEKKTMLLSAPKPVVALPKSRIENVKEQKAQKVLPFASKEAQAKVEEAKAVYDRKKAVRLVLNKQAPKAKKISNVFVHKKPLPLTSTKQKVRAEKGKVEYDHKEVQPSVLMKAKKIQSFNVDNTLLKILRPLAAALPKSKAQKVKAAGNSKKAVQVPPKEIAPQLKSGPMSLSGDLVQVLKKKLNERLPGDANKKQVQLVSKEGAAKTIVPSHLARDTIMLSLSRKEEEEIDEWKKKDKKKIEKDSDDESEEETDSDEE